VHRAKCVAESPVGLHELLEGIGVTGGLGGVRLLSTSRRFSTESLENTSAFAVVLRRLIRPGISGWDVIGHVTTGFRD
jgi:hypothetical protein